MVAGMMPSRVSVKPKRQLSAAMATSQIAAIPIPPPMATPFDIVEGKKGAFVAVSRCRAASQINTAVPDESIFHPPKTKENQIFYSSEQFYIFIRFLYALYERMIRIEEIADSQEKIKLFELLYYSSIKTK